VSVDRAAIAAHAERQAEYARAEARRWTEVAEAFDRVAARYANPMETENDSEAA
jgi:hypothetical protein